MKKNPYERLGLHLDYLEWLYAEVRLVENEVQAMLTSADESLSSEKKDEVINVVSAGEKSVGVQTYSYKLKANANERTENKMSDAAA